MNKSLFKLCKFLHWRLPEAKRLQLWRMTRSGAATLREMGDTIKRGGMPAYIMPPETDSDFIMRLAHRPSWYYHKPRLLRIAKVLIEKEKKEKPLEEHEKTCNARVPCTWMPGHYIGCFQPAVGRSKHGNPVCKDCLVYFETKEGRGNGGQQRSYLKGEKLTEHELTPIESGHCPDCLRRLKVKKDNSYRCSYCGSRFGKSFEDKIRLNDSKRPRTFEKGSLARTSLYRSI